MYINVDLKNLNMKTFSVIVPYYNSKDYITKNIESIINNDYPLTNVEIIIVDDGSKDNNEVNEVLNPYINQYPNLIKLYKKKNGNWGSVINFVKDKKLAHNELIMVLDSDDWISSDFFSKVNQKFDDADLFIASFYMETKNFTYIVQPYYLVNKKITDDSKYTLCAFPGSIVYKNALFYSLKNLYEKVSFQDIPLFFNALKKANVVKWTSRPISHYWSDRPGNSYSQGFNDKKLNDQLLVYKCLKKLDLDEHFYWLLLQRNFFKTLVDKDIKLEIKDKPKFKWAPPWMRWYLELSWHIKFKKVLVPYHKKYWV